MAIYVRLVRQRRDFRFLWLAQVVSMMGDWFSTIALVILINRYTESGLAVGALFIARTLPRFFFAPFAGVVADRFNRKFVLIATDVLRAVLVLGFLLVNSADTIWLIYAITILQFVVSTFFEPAQAAILPSLITPDELVTANALSNATWSTMLALGAAAGGVIAAIFGVQIAILVDALTFLLSAVFIVFIALPQSTTPAMAGRGGWLLFLDGLRYIRQHPYVGLIATVKALGQVGSFDIIIAIFAARVFPLGEDGSVSLGIMFTISGIGAILGPLLGNLLGDGTARALERWITLSFLIFPIGWFVLGAAPTLILALIGIFMRGLAGSNNWAFSSALIQMHVPDRYLGRVFAFDFAVFTLGHAASVWLTGVAVDSFSGDPRRIVFWMGVLSIAPLLFWMFAIRRQRSLTEAQAATPARHP